MDLFRNHFQGMHVYSGFIGMSLGVSTETFLCKKIFRIHQGRMMLPERMGTVFSGVLFRSGRNRDAGIAMPADSSQSFHPRNSGLLFFAPCRQRGRPLMESVFSNARSADSIRPEKSAWFLSRFFALERKKVFMDYGIIKIPKGNRKLIFLY